MREEFQLQNVVTDDERSELLAAAHPATNRLKDDESAARTEDRKAGIVSAYWEQVILSLQSEVRQLRDRIQALEALSPASSANPPVPPPQAFANAKGSPLEDPSRTDSPSSLSRMDKYRKGRSR